MRDLKKAFNKAALDSSDSDGVPVGGKDTLNIINFFGSKRVL